LGYTQQLPTEDRYLMTLGAARADLRVAGSTRGGGDDLRRCFNRRTERSAKGDRDRPDHGDAIRMSERLGLVALEGQRQPVFLPVGGPSSKEYSEETARIVDEEIKRLLTDAH
jgi:cell division protease FtsH